MALSDLERKILGAVQSGLPMSRTPFEALSRQTGIPVDHLLEVFRQWQAEGKSRRVGAIVNHFRMGRGVGAMVVWNVPEDRIGDVGDRFAMITKVSHAYLRPSNEQWPYNLYTMVHASEEQELSAIVEGMSRESGISDYQMLRTQKELKKVPPTYVTESPAS